MEPVLCYSSGPSERALIGETIGPNLARTVAAHGTREAVVDVATGRRMTYAQFAEAVDDVALVDRSRVASRATGSSGRRERSGM
jgi:fatty-acyl-CoA synthase